MINKEFIKYILFAVLSTLLNCFIQISSESFFHLLNINLLNVPIYKSVTSITIIKMGLATAGGFVFKYIADKYVVFKVTEVKAPHESLIMIALYGVISIFTTVIYWGTQLAFKIIFNHEYVGLVLGLAVGYTVKYLLDKRFVFCKDVKGLDNLFFIDID